MRKCECCGNCKFYDEWKNGLCDKSFSLVEPEESGCNDYKLNKDGMEE